MYVCNLPSYDINLQTLQNSSYIPIIHQTSIMNDKITTPGIKFNITNYIIDHVKAGSENIFICSCASVLQNEHY